MLFQLVLTLSLIEDAYIRVSVSQLGAEEFDRREQATRILQALGPRTYPELKKAASSPNPEVRRRAERLVESLKLKAFQPAAERLITLESTRKPLLRNQGTILV